MVDLKGVQSGLQAQKYHFLVSFVNHTDSVEKTWNLANFILIIVALHWLTHWQFYSYRSQQKWWEMVQEKHNFEKSFFFLYLNKRTIFEHLVQGETNTDVLSFIFQNPFTISKLVLEREI